MANITITQPFKIIFKNKVHIDAQPSDKKAVAKTKKVDILKWTYKVGGVTYNLPTSGSASSTAGTDAANLGVITETDPDGGPVDAYTVAFNTGTASRVPTTGNPYRVEITSVTADMIISGASTATTYASGGELLLEGGGTANGPTHPPVP